MNAVTFSDCFQNETFAAWFDEAFDYIEGSGFHCLGFPDKGWQLYSLVLSFNGGDDPIAAVERIVKEYDPTL